MNATSGAGVSPPTAGRGLRTWVAMLAGLALAGASAAAQIAMPDPREMSGLPLPVGELPDGTISVRLIRGQLSNNISAHPIELHVGESVVTEQTDENGRARFSGLAAGSQVRALAIVDGERLESREFAVPARGGIRLMLVATARPANGDADPTGTLPEGSSPAAPQPGSVVLGGDSRVFIELSNDALQVYYLLDIVNAASTPVMPAETLLVDLPTGAQGGTVLEGSAPQAHISGTRLTVPGPFDPGRTPVHVVYVLPLSGAEVSVTQVFPSTLERTAIVAKKTGGLDLESPLIENSREMTAEGATYVIADGQGVAAGEPLRFRITGLPHHSATPRYVALGLATLIVAVGAWAGLSTPTPNRTARRKKLGAKRDTLLGELVRVEERHRSASTDARVAKRRRELRGELERVYAELDRELVDVTVATEPSGPSSARSTGAADV